MKNDIHPEVHRIKMICACGTVTETLSTLRDDYRVDICSNCHPFFTGKQRLVDTAGRIERFQKKYQQFEANKTAKAAKAAKSTATK